MELRTRFPFLFLAVQLIIDLDVIAEKASPLYSRRESRALSTLILTYIHSSNSLVLHCSITVGICTRNTKIKRKKEKEKEKQQRRCFYGFNYQFYVHHFSTCTKINPAIRSTPPLTPNQPKSRHINIHLIVVRKPKLIIRNRRQSIQFCLVVLSDILQRDDLALRL
jgi:hypothetical protein